MIHGNSSPTSVPGESADRHVGDFFSPSPSNDSARPLKRFTSVPEQIELLRTRGLGIENEQHARAVLRRIGYFRFSGYAHSLRSRVAPHDDTEAFRGGASFATIEGLIEFDETLRFVVLDGLETIELAIRAAVAARIGHLDVEAHRNERLLDRKFTLVDPASGMSRHAEWQRRFDELCSRSKEDFVEHHRRHYGGKLPVWAAMEVFDFGLLSRFVAGLQSRDRESIARHFLVGHSGILCSWMHMFNVTRNRAAHHSRLWNRTTTKIPLLPPRGANPELVLLHDDKHALTRLFGTLCCMQWMLRAISPQSDWHRQLKTLIASFPDGGGLSLRSAGFPPDWTALPLWRD